MIDFSKKYFLFLMSVVLIALTSCNEEPTFMGADLLLDTVEIYPISTSEYPLITNLSSYRQTYNSFNRGVFHVGVYKDMKAISFLRFLEPIKDTNMYDFLIDYNESQLKSCKLRIPVSRYTLGDSINSNALSFKIYKVDSYWSNESTWDTVFNENIIDMNSLVGEFKGNIDQGDTINNLEIDMDKSLLLEWFNKWYQYRNGDSTQIQWGIALVPDDNSKVIRTFVGPTIGSTDNASTLEIIFDNPDNVEDTLNIEAGVDKSFYSVPEYQTGELQVQGGVETRGMMEFDVSMIPKYSSIHTAQLELNIDRSKCIWGNFNLDSTLYAELPDDSSDVLEENFIRTYYAERTLDKFYFTSITSAIEKWTRKEGKGFIVVHPEGIRNSLRELDKMVFYGLDAEASLKPKLTIIYSVRPYAENE